jgi:hypothetical protein
LLFSSGAGSAVARPAHPWPRNDSASPEAIAAEYAPWLFENSGEPFVPVDRARYVELTSLWKLYDRTNKRDIHKLVSTKPRLDTLPTKPLPCPAEFRQCHYYLHVRGHFVWEGAAGYGDTQAAILEQEPRPIVYWSYRRQHQTIQYWFFYVFNEFDNWHEADWEQITLKLGENGPVRVGFSSHNGGESVEWSNLDERQGRMGDHVFVFVAWGSHANYFTPGWHPVSECFDLCWDQSDGCGPTLGPTDYVLRQFEPHIFSGDYGSGNFLAGGLISLGSKINVSDPQTRKNFMNPLSWLEGTREAAPNTSEEWCSPVEHSKAAG